jgi:hypothetical protein
LLIKNKRARNRTKWDNLGQINLARRLRVSSQSTVPSALDFASHHHFHLDDDVCPACEQPIPPEKLSEIKGKIAAMDRERTLEITANLEGRFELEKRKVVELAEQRMHELLLAAENIRKEQAADWQKTLEEAAAAKKSAEDGNVGLREDLLKTQRDSAVAIEAAAAEAKHTAEILTAQKLAQAEAIRKESEAALFARVEQAELATEQAKAATKQAVDTAVAEKLADANKARKQSEAELLARAQQAELVAEQTKVGATQAVHAAVAEKLAEADKARKESEAQLLTRAQQAESLKTDAEEALRVQQIANAQAVSEAKAKLSETENQSAALKLVQEVELAKSLEEQRVVLEKATEDAVNVERAKSFEDHQKLKTKVADLTRDLERKTNEELGEGAEIDLFEALKEEFPDDKITRVKKGEPGADIIHVVLLKGQSCGTIVYDSKNHKAYRTDHVTKLRLDQLGANAEHAVLSTHKFPQGTRQLHMVDGVLLANPARVVQLAMILRRHLIQVYTLSLSNVERDGKTEDLYRFITSEKCTLLFGSIEGRSDELMALQEKEIKWHQNNWSKQGEKIRAIQKAKADLENEISLIVGTVDETENEDIVEEDETSEAS